MMQTAMPTVTLAVVIRDEGPYLLEWIAWHKLIGFDRIVIYDNESADSGPELLARLQEAGEIVHHPWPDLPDEPPQMRAFLDAAAHCEPDWIAFFDADEFLVLHTVACVGDLLGRLPAACSGVAVNQRFFGSSGWLSYKDRPVIERFVMAGPPNHPLGRWVKSIVRPGRVKSIHQPHAFELTEGYYADPTGRPCHLEGLSVSDAISLDVAQYNHYVLKSREEYAWKQKRGRGTLPPGAPTRFEKYSDAFFQAHDLNLVREEAAVSRLGAVRVEMQRLRQVCETAGR